MRCLYCGKELPLFKRLRGGEFCSDAHRQSYQEEYTQLALSRLLQANSSGELTPADAKAQNGGKGIDPKPDTRPAEAKPDARPEGKPHDKRPPDVRPMESPAVKRRERLTREEAPAEPLQQTAVLDPEPVVTKPDVTKPIVSQPVVMEAKVQPEPVQTETDPALAPELEEPPPAGLGGFHIEVPLPLLFETPALVKQEAELSSSALPELPRSQEFRLEAEAAFLSNAGPVPLPRSVRAGSYAPPRERGLEEREFVRSPAPVEIRLAPAGEAGLENSAEVFVLKFDFCPPQEAPAAWQESAREFSIPGVVFEESARLDFESSGWGEGAREEESPETNQEGDKADPPKPMPLATPIVLASAEPARPRPVVTAPVSPSPSVSSVSLDRMSLASLTAAVERPAAEGEAKQEGSQPAPAATPSPAQAFIPEAITKPLPLTLHGLATGRGKPTQVFSSALPRPAEIQAPRQSALPLRPVMVLGPAPRLVPEKQAPAAEVPVKDVPVKDVPIKDVPVKTEPQSSGVKPRKSEVRVLKLQLPDQKKGEIRKEEAKPEPAKKEAAVVDAKPESKPEAKPEFKLDIKRVPAPQPVPPKVESKPTPSKAPVPSPAVAAKKDTPVESKVPATETKTLAAEPAKPKAPEAPKESAPPSREPDLLGLPKLSLEPQGNFWSNLPAVARIGIAAGVLAAIIGGVFLTSKGSSAPRAAVTTGSQEANVVEAGPPIGSDSGWATDWFADRPGARQPRHVDVLNGSLALRDYRIEFEGQIDQQALGWVFRANNKSTFYVEKVQIVSPGLSPIVALIKFAVIDGKEQMREQVPIPVKVHLDTLYKIRTDVVGRQFTTWVQDQKVDSWTDSRIDGGGVGLYYDSGDSAKLKGTINVIPLKLR
jgi:hypothetical protein